MMKRRTVREVDLQCKRILLRADFNVPLRSREVTDDWRIRATLSTIHYLQGRDCRVTICSHLGRPKGKPVSDLSLKPVADRLSKLLGQKIIFADNCIGEGALKLSKALRAGEILLLENTRFHPEETENKSDFAKDLSLHGEFFVDDAFAVAHRAHASNVGVAQLLPSAAGLLIESEVNALSSALEHIERPLIAVFGGAKILDKLDAIKKIGLLADRVLLGGAIANTAFKAQGLEVGTSLIDQSALPAMTELLQTFKGKLVLPQDVVVRMASGQTQTLDPKNVPRDGSIVDGGEKTLDSFLGHLKYSGEVFWNGPLGLFEKQPFDQGTLALARGLSVLKANVYVGGGDTGRALAMAGVREKVTHASTGGGAFMDFLAGKTLPGLAVLPESEKQAA